MFLFQRVKSLVFFYFCITGASGNHVAIHCYPSNLEDFAGVDMTRLDTWVFEEVEAIIIIVFLAFHFQIYITY